MYAGILRKKDPFFLVIFWVICGRKKICGSPELLQKYMRLAGLNVRNDRNDTRIVFVLYCIAVRKIVV